MAIYMCIESALRWGEMYSEILEKERFTIHPYDKCVKTKLYMENIILQCSALIIIRYQT